MHRAMRTSANAVRCTAVEPSSASATMDEEKFPGLVNLGRTRENEGKGTNGFGCRRRFRHFHDARARPGLALGASRGPGRERYHLSARSVATAALQQVLQRVVQQVVCIGTNRAATQTPPDLPYTDSLCAALLLCP